MPDVDRLRRREARLRSLVTQIPGMVWTTDRQLRFTSGQGAALAEVGLTGGDGLDIDYQGFFGTSDGRDAAEEAHRSALEGTAAGFELRLAGRIFRCRVQPLLDDDGVVEGTIGLGIDVTKRRALEEEVRRSRDRLQTLLDNLPHPFGIYRPVRDAGGRLRDFEVEYVNQAAAEGLGIPGKQQIGRPLTELFPAHVDSGLLTTYRQVVESGRPSVLSAVPFEDRSGVVPVDGVFDISAFPLNGDLAITWREVGEEQRHATELRASRERLEAVVRHAPVVLFALDRDGVFTLSTGGGLERLGLEDGEVVGRSVFEVFAKKPDILKDVKQALDGEELSGTSTVWGATFSVRYSPLRDEDGEVTGTIGVATDRTAEIQAQQAREKVEEELHQAQKMEAVGRLAGGVAHDFNNLLTVIKGNAEFLRTAEELSEEHRAEATEIHRTADRGAELTRQLLTFSRQEPRTPELLDVSEAISDAAVMLRRLIDEDVEVHLRTADEPLPVLCDRRRLEQVLMNLVVNARDAMPHGGELRIETSLQELEEGLETSHSDVGPGRYARLVVSDTGEGMTPETQRKVFEPFFTTKPEGEGTGLGLSTVWGIIRQAGGHVHVYSEPGQGTAFRIYVPLAEGAVEPTTRPRSAPPYDPVEHVPGRVLLVEDDPAVNDLVTRLLERAGHTVIRTTDPREALELAASLDPPADLLLTDVVMPGMTGPELAEAMLERWPDLRVLFTSGYSEAELQARRHVVDRAAFIEKPFDLSDFLRVVRRALV